MNTLKTIVDCLALIGIPSIFAMTMWCVKKCTTYTNQLKILHKAQKAQMRAQLMRSYYEIKERTYAWDDELDEWINQYTAYHELVGPNDVLDARKMELLKIRTEVR